jgi:hypothetical protein
MAGGEGIAGGDGMAGGDGISGTGISTVPSPPVVVVGNSGDGAVVGGATVVSTVVSAEVVSDVVEVDVSSSAESLPHAVSNEATATPEAKANRTGFDALREVMKPPLTRGSGG